MHNMSICCAFSPARRGALLLLRHVLRVLEGGINMQDQRSLGYPPLPGSHTVRIGGQRCGLGPPPTPPVRRDSRNDNPESPAHRLLARASHRPGAPVCLPGRECLGAFPCRWRSACHSVGPMWPGSALSSTAAPRPRCCLAGWRQRRLRSRGPPHWPPLCSGPASSRATARHPSIGTDPETGVACQLWLCWLSPAGRVASGPPVRPCPAAVACAGSVLPSRPAPCRGLSPPLSPVRAKTPPPYPAGCPCDRTAPPAWPMCHRGAEVPALVRVRVSPAVPQEL